MALTSNDERRSMRRTMRNEAGRQVLAMNLSYEQREIVLQIERIDTAYCAAHPQDVQDAVSAFILDGNAMLREAELPEITQ